MYQKPFITKLHLVNFRSIRDAVIEFDNPLFLVGQNGTGKSNILDAFNFLSDCLSRSLPISLATRRRISGDLSDDSSSHHTGLRIDFQINEKETQLKGHYAYTLRKPNYKRLIVEQEQCSIFDVAKTNFWFNRIGTNFSSNIEGFNPKFSPISLSLPIVGSLVQFAPVFEALSEIHIYDINSKVISQTSDLDDNSRLNYDGSNLASVIYYLTQNDSRTLKRITQMIQAIVPTISSIKATATSFNGDQVEKVTISCTQDFGNEGVARLRGDHLSSGTLHILALIVASMQTPSPKLIAIEEPETGLHPGALDTIAEIIENAASDTQIIVTTHSPDLLDAKWIKSKNIRVVNWKNGETSVSYLGSAPVKMLQEHLMGAGRLMRANALDSAPLASISVDRLFDTLPV